MENLKVIHYYPELREYVGSINAVLIASHLEDCFKEKGKKFCKFLEPCGHGYYKEGESWIEVLHMTGTEFRTAFKHIGVVYKSKREYNCSQDKFQGKMYLSYYDRISKLTYYMRNDELVERVFSEQNKDENKEDATSKEVEDRVNKNKQVIGDERASIIETTQVASKAEDMSVVEEQYIRNDESEDGIINHKTYALISLNNTKNNSLNNSLKDSLSLSHTTNYLATNLKNQTESKTNRNTDCTALNVAQDSSILEVQESLKDSNACQEDRAYIKSKAYQEIEEDKSFLEQGIDFKQALEIIKDLFNHICFSYDEVIEWTDKQEQKIGQIWWIYNQNLEVFKTAFEKLEVSDFLSGRIKSWKASLDWILTPMHFADILADKYKNFRKVTRPIGTPKEAQSDERWDFDEIERLERERIDRILEKSNE